MSIDCHSIRYSLHLSSIDNCESNLVVPVPPPNPNPDPPPPPPPPAVTDRLRGRRMHK